MTKIKEVLAWSVFVSIFGSFTAWTIYSVYYEELSHGDSKTVAALMTALLVASITFGYWCGVLFSERLKKAFIYAALHPYPPKFPKSRT